MIRRQREVEGKSWSELARLHGISRNRINRRAQRELWRQPGEVIQKATDDFARRLVAQEGDAVLQNLRQTLELTARIRALVARLLDRLELLGGDFDPHQLKCAAEIARKAHGIDAEIAGIRNRDQAWRPSLRPEAAGPGFHDEAVRRALDRLARQETPESNH